MESFTLTSRYDDLKLAGLICLPASTPKGAVQIVHGMCEHKERYIPFMEWLAAQGFIAVCHDHRGHGASVKSPDDLGYMYDGGWKALVDDTHLVTEYIRGRYHGIRLTLFGHSMGSLVVRSYVKRYDADIDQLFVCGCPSDNPAKGAGKFIAKMCGVFKGWHSRPKLLQKMSFGAYNKPFESEGWSSAWVCSNPEILKAYHNDPLCQFIFTANGFYNLLGLMQDCYSLKGWNLTRPSLPIRFISGAEDPCRVSDKALENAVEKMRQAGYKDVTLKTYQGMRHEILNETGRQTVWNDILEQC